MVTCCAGGGRVKNSVEANNSPGNPRTRPKRTLCRIPAGPPHRRRATDSI